MFLVASTRWDFATLEESVDRADMLASPVHERVRRLVASYARDRDDCRMLLEALGLAAPEESTPAADPEDG
ncbi:hypothetical protein [Kitasatospora sp. MBT63]|uniref:hypothetical protein n=1 Tax=Kitasatospora sp. MBT63 TaxID=1444768 RepID=UPI00131472FE|nr:hypothetical protein [Kitasatospora sp. MBT63]